jgi:Porin PorA
MRRVVWPVLTGLGVFLIVLALMLKFYVPGQAVKAPLNEHSIGTLQGTGLSYFSAAQLQELTGVTMRATSTVEGDVVAAKAAGSSHIAVWKSFTAVEDLTNHQPFSYSSQTLAFDRKDGQLVNCCGEFIDSNHHLNVSAQGYLWPFKAQKKSYQVFDTTLLKPVTFNFAGTATTDGLATYRYVVHTPNQQIGTQTLPASLLGLPGAEVTLPEFYTASKTYWVDPVTGAPLQVTETQRITLQDSSGVTRLVLFAGTLASTAASVQSAVAIDKPYNNEINLVEGLLPIFGIVLGLVLLVVGLVLSRSRTDDEAAGHEEEEKESADSPA